MRLAFTKLANVTRHISLLTDTNDFDIAENNQPYQYIETGL